jgi:lipid-A-disaccharide synthase
MPAEPPATAPRAPRVAAPAGPAPLIVLSAGEASGDLHGATLCRALRAAAPHARLTGMGGPRMAAAGMEVTIDVTRTAVVGGTEAVGRLPGLYRAFRHLRARLAGPDRPAALVLVDFPEFNLRLARAARRAGVPVVYFIPPQIWAWRPWRVRTIRRRVDLVLAVFPFEPPIYRAAGVPVEHVGHPVLDALAAAPTREQARAALGVEAATPTLGLLPGSRREEVERLLPAMRAAARRVAAAHPGLRVLVGLADTIAREAVVAPAAGEPPLQVVTGATPSVMRAADLLLVASGTATLEAALLGTPMVVCYRVSLLTELGARLLVRVPWISLANLTLGRAVVPELYRAGSTGEGLAREALRLLGEPGALEAQRRAFAELPGRLGAPGVGDRAARLVLRAAGVPSA